MDEVITPDLASLVREQIRSYLILQSNTLKISKEDSTSQSNQSTQVQTREVSFQPLPRTPYSNGIEKGSESEERSMATDETLAADLSRLQSAFDRQVLYIIGKEQMHVKSGTKLWRRLMLTSFLWLRDNTRTKVANLRVQTDRVVEVGFVKDV